MQRDYTIYRLVVGAYQENCYILTSDRDTVIIDPGAEGEKIINLLEENKLRPSKILLTHAHPDHFGAVEPLRQHYGIACYVSKDDNTMLHSRSESMKAALGLDSALDADVFYEDAKLNFLDKPLTVLETPGHTPGGVCIQYEDILFSGDTLFHMSIGRTDLPGGDSNTLFKSLSKLMTLDDAVNVLPGHGAGTTIGFERQHNPFINRMSL
ncbi:MBL fold metallo-hydrolase [Peptoniphilus equinus]|uniref:MBL fold metallo-hydrolase n=1 Tax=Peptoniphilus equinus TaxID=3016343 RepID=A0ABY7QX32_9FIRM|nr:MBL fold metallo-hydrolase [Peptoniphilus equinus]WBW50654.1 MBL fold metallo-hydrolase [Peptoniphilus equinus]